MAEIITFVIFIAELFVFLFLKINVVYALCVGLCLFIIYAFCKKFSFKEIFNMIKEGINGVKSVLFVFFFIGMITAVWRAGGTVPYIIYYSVKHINPTYFAFYAFLLCTMMSFLLGTAFGTAGTMGIICISIARSLNLNEILIGGAILSGAYFGDRCSPMSSSAILISDITDTDLYNNIKNMLKTAFIPFLISCLIYFILGKNTKSEIDFSAINALENEFVLNHIVFIPALIVIILSLCKVSVKKTMLISIISGILICFFVQKNDIREIFKILWRGYRPDYNSIMSGGGIIYMSQAFFTVGISSTYFGFFKNTELLNPFTTLVDKLKVHMSSFSVLFILSLIISLFSCNQTLAIMLSCQIGKNLFKDKNSLALSLENTAALLPVLIPWNISGSVPLDTIEVSMYSIFYSFFIFAVPLWNMFKNKTKA